MHYECKYCDSGFGPILYSGDSVCSGCGAEWESAKVLVDGEENEN